MMRFQESCKAFSGWRVPELLSGTAANPVPVDPLARDRADQQEFEDATWTNGKTGRAEVLQVFVIEWARR